MPNSNFTLLSDPNGRVIQALAPVARDIIAVGAASARCAIPAGSTIVRIATNCSAFIKFGTVAVDAAADATSDLFPTGSEFFVVPEGATHIAAIRAAAADTGHLTISKMA